MVSQEVQVYINYYILLNVIPIEVVSELLVYSKTTVTHE